jgi:hypothetical protein
VVRLIDGCQGHLAVFDPEMRIGAVHRNCAAAVAALGFRSTVSIALETVREDDGESMPH